MPDLPRFAAQVVLAGAPDRAVAESVVSAFQAHGFQVGALVDGSFGIDGDRTAFKEAFGVALAYNADGSVRIAGARGGTVTALPLTRVPPTLRGWIKHVLIANSRRPAR